MCLSEALDISFHQIHPRDDRRYGGIVPIDIIHDNLNASDSGLHHTVSLMYVGGRHIGFGTTLENKMTAPS
ncbi:hypothetical protein DPMN_151698 [Dreissena polymorpha]|uniref:Uncharacterized protein n=1 Tax=Dreissena polymorpha TaxID=45954 RepID=A0A9D4J780_DREPO|nr:hypothetical protein DPMN_151698 [Dreissena polymorpha]